MRELKIRQKKAQLKIQQMIFMIIALTVFFVLVVIFFISLKVVNLQQDVESLKEDKAIGLSAKIASAPEFLFESESNSIDADKLMILQGETRYRYFWGVKGVIIQKIYLKEEIIECTRQNYPNCNKIKLFTNTDFAGPSSFVAWCSKQTKNGRSYDKCDMAILMVEPEELSESN